jgi:hypothetical protein
MSTNDTDLRESIDLDARTERALTEVLAVCPDIDQARGAPGLFVVVGENAGGEYLVDEREGACTCPDAEYRNPVGGCKHVRRVEFWTGARELPDAVDVDYLEADLREHLRDEGRLPGVDGGDQEADEAPRAVADGGRVAVEGADDADVAAGGDRPDDCACHEAWHVDSTPCFACYREGFETPNPQVIADE